MQDFTKDVVRLIMSIPRGKVCTYGQLAWLAGKPTGARQVSRILHSMSKKHHLPWHRVINVRGRISLRRGAGYEEQRALLEAEGVEFGLNGRVDLEVYLWRGGEA